MAQGEQGRSRREQKGAEGSRGEEKGVLFSFYFGVKKGSLGDHPGVAAFLEITQVAPPGFCGWMSRYPEVAPPDL